MRWLWAALAAVGAALAAIFGPRLLPPPPPPRRDYDAELDEAQVQEERAKARELGRIEAKRIQVVQGAKERHEERIDGKPTEDDARKLIEESKG